MLDEHFLFGQLYSNSGVCYEGATAWMTWVAVDGTRGRQETLVDDEGRFTLGVPLKELAEALVGLDVEGAAIVDLRPGGRRLSSDQFSISVADRP